MNMSNSSLINIRVIKLIILLSVTFHNSIMTLCMTIY